MYILRDISIIWMFLHCIILFMLLYESRYSKKTTNIATAIFVIPLIILNMLSVTFLPGETVMQLLILTCVIPSFIFFFIMAKYRNMKFIFTFCFVDTVILWVLFFTKLLDHASGVDNFSVMLISRLVMVPILEFFIVRYVKKPYREFQQKIKRGWGVFTGMSIVFYGALLVISSFPVLIYDHPEFYPHLIAVMALLPMMYITVYYILWNQLKQHEVEEEIQILQLQKKAAEEKISGSSEMESRVRILKHDMKHHMLLLNSYIETGNLEQAQKHIKSITANIEGSETRSYCKNQSINFVLSHYAHICRNNEIKLDIQASLPEQLSISETDIAVILSNSIENAINAAKSQDKKEIVVKAFTDNEKLFLEIKNHFDGNITFSNGLPVSTKENHGFGTKSMATLVEKNNGIYSFVMENDEFVFRCAI